MIEQEWADVARLRQGLYRFFAAALLTPDDERVAHLREAAALLDTLGIDRFSFAPSWQELRTVMAAGTQVGALAGEHVRLFHATSGEPLCPPVESFYGGSARQGSAALGASAVEATYRRHGLAFGKGAAYMPDEASPELEFMAFLCGAEAVALEHGDEARAAGLVAEELRFLEDHLASWFPAFADRVGHSRATGFYPALVEAAVAFVEHDRELASMLADGEGGEP